MTFPVMSDTEIFLGLSCHLTEYRVKPPPKIQWASKLP